MTHLLILVLLLTVWSSTFAQPPLGGGIDDQDLDPIQPGTGAFNQRGRFQCRQFFRELDGTCTSDGTFANRLWGSAGRPQFSLFTGRPASEPRGLGLRSARQISNILFKQTHDVFDTRRVAEIAVFFGQFIDHTLVATPTNHDEPFPIPIRRGDVRGITFANGTLLQFSRSQRVKVAVRDNEERPSNTLSSAIDLTNVYGPAKTRNNELRTGIDGMLAVSADGKNLLPKNIRRFNNAPNPQDTSFFLAGDHRVNEHPILTSLHTLFLREHNTIAAEVNEAFPDKGMEERYEIAKKINEAQFQKIVFEEWFPAITGRRLPKYNGFKRNIDPTISLSFSTAGFRVGHTMVGNSVQKRGPGNSLLPSISFKNIFFKVVKEVEDNGIEPFLRGAMQTRAQRIDLLVHDALRDFLFENIPGEEGANFDLIALNIQRGRDHALPSYNALRRRMNRPKAIRFDEITRDRATQSRLQAAYASAGQVEAFPGLLAEDHEEGSSFGPTLLTLWRWEFTRFRDGDRLFFRNRGVWQPEVRALPRVRRLLENPGLQVFRQVILDNTDITPQELPGRMFFA